MSPDEAPPLGFHSLDEEVTTAVPVEGTLPDWLSGVLIRNGPGAFSAGGERVDHWFDGLAMLRRFGLDGPADRVTYRNRFLRTDAYERARRGRFDGGFATGEAGLLRRLYRLLFGDPYDNTNVIAERIGGRHLALTESPRRVAFDPDTLATLGHDEYAGPAPSGQLACAHLRHDPERGTAVTFETAFGRTNRYHVHELAGDAREHVAAVPVEEPAYMHSFGLTPGYVVLTEFPFVVDPLDFLRPGASGPFVEHFRWEPERGTRFLVIDRATGAVVAEPRAEAFFGFHHANAYEADGDLVVDLETVPDASAVGTLSLDRLRSGDLDVLGGRLERFRIDPSAGTLDRDPIYEAGTALPTVPRTRWCRPHRYVYAQGTDQPVTEWPTALLKIDAESGRAEEYRGDDDHYGEPVMVPRPGADREDEGVVLAVGLDRDAERSSLVALDARSFDRIARAPLPHPLPFDFHGRWFPGLAP
ncbi:MAG: carotenoid oxygenase family protein [Haloferacaceae archaeon]